MTKSISTSTHAASQPPRLKAKIRLIKQLERNVSIILVTLISLTSAENASATNYIGHRVEIVGSWNGDYIEVTKLQQDNSSLDPKQGHLKGWINEVDIQSRRLRVGPILVSLNNLTTLKRVSMEDLSNKLSVEIVGQLVESAHLVATSITAVSIPDSHLEITGVVTEGKQRFDGITQLTVLGVPVEISGWDDIAASELRNVPHDFVIEGLHIMTFLKKPIAVGLELENNIESRIDIELADNADDDILEVEQLLTVELFYPIFENASFFLALEIFNEGQYMTELGKHETMRGVGREQVWLFVGNLFESNFSLQIGRQEYEEGRQWWWGDEELDVLTVHYDNCRLHAEFSIGQEIAKSSTEESRIDPEKEDVLRVIGQTIYEWTEDQRIEAIFLYQNDHSSQQSVGELIKERSEDPTDADLLWIGGRATGQLCYEDLGEFEYWFEGAGVFGEEDLFDFEETGNGLSEVTSYTSRDVSGWGFDVGFTWWTNLSGKPFFTLGYARGSGDRESDSGKDKSFRQTGLHANEDRYQYYGKLLEPELSNLEIWTASMGFRFWESCSIELVYHTYHQVIPTSFLRGAVITEDLEGTQREIGKEWDLVIILEGWENLELIISAALFNAGSAYGSLSDEHAYYAGFELTYRF